jgi:hypothetical protein
VSTVDATTFTVSWAMVGAIGAGLIVVVLALTYLARPRIGVRLVAAAAGPSLRTVRGQCGESMPLCLRVRMKHLTGRRGTSEIELNVHVISDIHLHLARYGPTQELTSRDVRHGKGASHSVQVGGIKIDKWEPTPFEDVEVWITAPVPAGKYLAWTTSFAHAGVGATGVTRFVFTVKDGRFHVRKVSYVGTWRLRVQRWFASPNPNDLPAFPSLVRAAW